MKREYTNFKHVDEVRKIPESDLSGIEKEIESLPIKTKHRLSALAQARCYDRRWCAKNNIDYDNIAPMDFNYALVLEYVRYLKYN